jgi:hypothetical protein
MIRERKAVFFAFVMALCLSAGVFAQALPYKTVISTLQDDLSTELAASGAYLAAAGLDWSDAYIGQLIDSPPHYAWGGAVGTTTMRIANMQDMLALFGKTVDPWFQEKQFFPYYLFEGRIGGARQSAFDMGVKASWLPSVPLFGDIGYKYFMFGGDIRFNLIPDYYTFPELSIGAEISYSKGAFTAKNAKDPFTSGLGTGTTPFTVWPASNDLELFWDALDMVFKVSLAKNFQTFSIFGGLDLGAAITHAGYKVISGTTNISAGGALADGNAAKWKTAAAALKTAMGSGEFECGADYFQSSLAPINISIRTYEGIGFNFESSRLDIALSMDIYHFEFGFYIGWRYQNDT